MILRPYQERAIERLRASLRSGHKRPVLQAATGAGKTILTASIIKMAREKNHRVIFTAPAISLIDQTVEKFHAAKIYDVGVIQQNHPMTNYARPVQVASVQTLARRKIPPAGLVVIDECFSGDTEILTERGFVRFDELGSERVAQVSSDHRLTLSWCSPEIVKTKPASSMIHLESDNLIDVTCTENHEMLVFKGVSARKISARSVRLNHEYYMASAAYSAARDDPLTAEERLAICAQADGSIHQNNALGTVLAFSFSKERKIYEFLRLMGEWRGEWREVSGRDSSVNHKAVRRFMVYPRKPFTKNLWDHFTLVGMSAQKAHKILDYAMIWDGHRNEGRDTWLYATTDKKSADFYQAASCLCGKRTKLSVVSDNRKETYSDVYRLSINQSPFFGTQNITRTPAPEADFVHCVRVPTGAIVVRSGGKTLVTGNCHLGFEFIYRWMADPEWKHIPFIGLSATPWARGMGAKERWDDLIVAATVEDLTNDGYLAPMRYLAPDTPDLSGIKMVAGDYNEGQLSERMRGKELLANSVEKWIELGEDRPTIAFCVDRAHAQDMQTRFVECGIQCGYIDAHTEIADRKRVGEQLESGEIRVVTSVGCLIVGLDWTFISCILHARPTKSRMLYIQSIGRGLRIHPGKADCLVLDCAGNYTLGHPYDIHYSKLDDGSPRDRAERKAKEERTAAAKECPSCGAVRQPRVKKCPTCGFEPAIPTDVVEGDAELVEIGRGGRRIGKSKKSLAPEDWTIFAKQEFMSELLAIQAERGYNPKWAAVQYRDRFGDWPNRHKVAEIPAKEASPMVRSWVRSRMIRYAKAKQKEAIKC